MNIDLDKKDKLSNHLKINKYFSIAIFLLMLLYMLYPGYEMSEFGRFIIIYFQSFFWWARTDFISSAVNVFIILLGFSSLCFFVLFTMSMLSKNLLTRFKNILSIALYASQLLFIVTLVYFGFLNRGAQDYHSGAIGGSQFIVISFIMTAVLALQIAHYIFIRLRYKQIPAPKVGERIKVEPVKLNVYFSVALLFFLLVYLLYPAFSRTDLAMFLHFFKSFAMWWTMLSRWTNTHDFFSFVLGIFSMCLAILLIVALFKRNKGTGKFFNRVFVTLYICQFAIIISLSYFGFTYNGKGGAEFIVISLIMATVLIAQVVHYIFIRRKTNAGNKVNP